MKISGLSCAYAAMTLLLGLPLVSFQEKLGWDYPSNDREDGKLHLVKGSEVAVDDYNHEEEQTIKRKKKFVCSFSLLFSIGRGHVIVPVNERKGRVASFVVCVIMIRVFIWLEGIRIIYLLVSCVGWVLYLFCLFQFTSSLFPFCYLIPFSKVL
ncbi:hypothetical protein Dimus_035391 [Dionaea muscipula]